MTQINQLFTHSSLYAKQLFRTNRFGELASKPFGLQMRFLIEVCTKCKCRLLDFFNSFPMVEIQKFRLVVFLLSYEPNFIMSKKALKKLTNVDLRTCFLMNKISQKSIDDKLLPTEIIGNIPFSWKYKITMKLISFFCPVISLHQLTISFSIR